MENKQIQNRKTEVIVDITCDCCGKSCKMYDGRADDDMLFSVFEFMKMEANWGYCSGKDTEKWTAQICEKCVDEKLSFIKFKKENYM